MSLIALDRMLRRRRRHLVALAAVFTIAGAVAMHHMSMDDMPMGMDDAAMVVCLAVLPGLAVAAVRLAAAATWAAPKLVALLPWTAPLLVLAPVPRARPGPVRTVVLRR